MVEWGRFVGAIWQEGSLMQVLRQHGRKLLVVALICVLSPCVVRAADETTLTKEQIENFLLTAKIVGNKPAGKGITHTTRLTLSDGTTTHDASFQSINETQSTAQLTSGTELGFVDSYRYNIAAFRLAELLGMDDVVPVYVDRKWKGDSGSLSWWLPVKMDEKDRVANKVAVPDPDAWNNQMYRVRVLDQLVYDSDANLTNVLITDDWKIWRIDFTRAFRLRKDLRNPGDLTHCERQLFEKLKALNQDELMEKTKHYLDKDEVKALMARRDKIVELFQKLITEKGENEVLY
jgi:hypothetical protein